MSLTWNVLSFKWDYSNVHRLVRQFTNTWANTQAVTQILADRHTTRKSKINSMAVPRVLAAHFYCTGSKQTQTQAEVLLKVRLFARSAHSWITATLRQEKKFGCTSCILTQIVFTVHRPQSYILGVDKTTLINYLT